MSNLFETKLTPEMKAFVIEKAEKNIPTGEIKKALMAEFDLDDDFISTSRISQIKNKAKKDARKRGKTPKEDSEPMTTEQLEQMEEGAVIVKDLAQILKEVIIKPKSKIESIYYGFQNHPEQDVWALLEYLTINGIAPVAQRRIILNYFGLDTVKEVWPSSKHKTLGKKVVDDPTSNVKRIVDKQIKSLEGKIALKELKDVWKEIQGKTDDPVTDLKRQVEFQTLLTRLENVNKNDAMGMLKEYRSMMKEDKSGEGTFLNTIKGIKELGLLGKQQGAGDSALVKLLQNQLDMSQKQSIDYRDLVEKLRDSSGEARIDALQKMMEMQLEAIAKDQMTVADWENLQLRRLEWAKTEGYVRKSDIDKDLTTEDRALKRVEKVRDSVEKLPDKLSESFDKSIDKLMNTIDKLSQIQERRRLLDQRRTHRQQVQLHGGTTPIPSPSQQDPNAFLDNLEEQIDEQKKWTEISDRGSDLDNT